MSEQLMHDPVLILDEKEKVVYLKCSRCGKELWRPSEECEDNAVLPTLRINVKDGLGVEDRFGG